MKLDAKLNACSESFLVAFNGGQSFNAAFESVQIVTDKDLTLDHIASGTIEGGVVLSVDSIAAHSFYGYMGITSLVAPNVVSVGEYAFCNSRSIGSLSIPNVKTVGANAFQYCNKITVLDAPNLTTMGAYAFSGNNTYKMAFKSINLPKLTAVPNSTFTYFASVAELVLPECKSVGNSSCTNWTNLQYVDLPKCTSISNYGLRNNSKLETLILRSETMCTLSNYALNSTKIFNGTGYVYVPSALISSYQTSTNWKTIYGKNANAFRALEDYTVDGTLSGALDEAKVATANNAVLSLGFGIQYSGADEAIEQEVLE